MTLLFTPQRHPPAFARAAPRRARLGRRKRNLQARRRGRHIGCNSLAFIGLEGLRSAVHADRGDFCDACFSGDYPVPIPDPLKRKAFL